LEDKLVVGIQTSVSRVNDETAPFSGTAGFRGDILGAAYSANPTWPADPNFVDGGTQLNPANWLEYSQLRTTTDRVLLNGSLEYKFTPELTAKVNVGYDKSEGENISVISGSVQNLSGIEVAGFGTYNVLERENKLLEATLNWKKDFDNSNIDVLLGYSFQDFRTSGFNAQSRGFGTTDLNRMARDLKNTVNGASASIDGHYQQFYYGVNTTSLIVNRLFPNVVAGEAIPFAFERYVQAMTADTFDNTDELQSYFTRINYALANKYLFTGTIRADGSSRFGPDNRYGYFPSGAFAWKINEEDFVGKRISTLKLRLSAGLTGNQEGLGYGNFVARQRFGGPELYNNFEVGQYGLVIVSSDNPNLQWEETFGLNMGIDFGFNLDRFNGSIDVYRNETDNLLYRLPPAAPSNSRYQFGNFLGTTLNQGIELALAYDFIQTQDSKLAVKFNIAYNKNELRDFPGFLNAGPGPGSGLAFNFIQRFGNGRPLFSYYMNIFEGFDSNGSPIYRDVDGDGNGDQFDRTFVGEDALPDVTSGLSINYKIKNWDFAACFQGQFGFSVYNYTANGLFNAGAITNARNVTQNVLTSGEGPGASTDVSTRFLEKGDFVRFQNATIGYKVPLSSDGFLTALRFSLTGQNLFLLTDYSGPDPEVTVAIGDLGNGVPSRGIDWSAFPNPRTFTFGVHVSF
jgi:iron complex outermembrane receptor protein